MIALMATGLLLLAGLIALVALIRGPGTADRIIALDVALIALMGGVAVDAAVSGDPTLLDLLVVIAIVGFTATVAISRDVARRRDEEEGR